MSARLSAFFVWAVLAASLVFWATQLLVKPLHVAARPVVAAPPPPASLDRLFGAAPVAVAAPASSRFVLLGVVAPRAAVDRGREGLAVIAVDGQARTVRLGGVVDGDLRLVAVEPRAARIGHAGVAEMTLQLPDPTPVAAAPPVVPQGMPPGMPVVPAPAPAAPLATPQVISPPPQQPQPNGMPPG
ncbi:MAG: hypothetical protein JO224_08730 [Pelomonas sp.]|nr:hypothetical protein [Roseateles sp.]